MFAVQAYLVASGIMAVCLFVEVIRDAIKYKATKHILVDGLLCIGLGLIWWFIVYLWIKER